MRILMVLPFLILTAPALAAPDDAQCAATFSALSASARAHGMSSEAFDRMAGVAGRHAGDFSGQVRQVRDLTLTDLSARVVNCHARYDRMRGDTRIAAISE